MKPEFLLKPIRVRTDAMIAMACEVCGLDRARLDDIDADPGVLQARQLAAWLMVERADVLSFDAAGALGVEPQFVNSACFTVRRRLASRGTRIDGPDVTIAAQVRDLLAPSPAALVEEPLTLADCLSAVCLAFGLSRAEIKSAGRKAYPARARHCFCWLASIASTAGPKEIGRWINRERTSVSHGVTAVGLRAGLAALRDDVLNTLASGRPSGAELLAIGLRLESLTRPEPATQTLERLNP